MNTYSIDIQNEVVVIKNTTTGEVEKQISKSITQIRTWIVTRYNWNAIVKMMRFCENEVADFKYQFEHLIEGKESDEQVIVPLEGIKALIEVQLLKSESDTFADVDGLPGNQFVKTIMGYTSKEDLMNESDNVSMIDAGGNSFSILSMTSSTVDLYDYFHQINQAKNGIWSTKTDVRNIIGVRRSLDINKTVYNDTIAVCWLDASGEKQIHLYVSTTEPGSITANRKLVPQTLHVTLGYHKGRQPAGRTSKALVREANNAEVYTFRGGDTTMNFHHGGNGGINIKGLVTNGLSTNFICTTATQRALNLKYVEAFRILTKWGERQNVTAYQKLKSIADIHEITVLKIEDRKASLQDGSHVVQKSIAPMVSYIASKYGTNAESKTTLVQILQSADNSYIAPANLAEMSVADIESSITVKQIEGILKKQAEYLSDIAQVDGKPGRTYLNILAGKIPSIDSIKGSAVQDNNDIDRLLTEIKELEGNQGATKVNYLKNLKPGTWNERNIYQNQSSLIEENEDDSETVEQAVGAWSQGCQVVFGPEKFYEFWSNVVQSAHTVGQMQWYYTLVSEEMLG